MFFCPLAASTFSDFVPCGVKPVVTQQESDQCSCVEVCKQSDSLTCLITVELACWRDVVLVQYFTHSLEVSFNLFSVAGSASVAV
jgi:hypothetical protein